MPGDREPRAGASTNRVIDAVRGDRAGPTLIVVGGIHGNEPAGVEAARRVIDGLRAAGTTLAGELVALVGNRRALAATRRYLVRDLNRQWSADAIAAARAAVLALPPPEEQSVAMPLDGETFELVELADELEAVMARARGQVFALDLHTTSADGIPFAVVGPSPAHHAFAAQFPLPGILGLEEQLDGVLTRYLGGRGCVTMAVEGGQNQSAEAAANLEAVITLALVAAGLVSAGDLPDFQASGERLSRARGDLPQLTEVVVRHAIEPAHGFRMAPGFANIQRTDGGTLLARDRGGEIRAPFDGLVLLPLYQTQGGDGFFYGREVQPRDS